MFFFPSFFIKANCIFMILGVKFIDLGINCKKKKKIIWWSRDSDGEMSKELRILLCY